jgi:hypothetical protein
VEDIYTDYVNGMEENISAIKRKTESVLEASMEVGLDVNTQNTNYMFMCPITKEDKITIY